jgi:hypothetical protein
MTERERETLRRFVAKCEHFWPGCKVVVRDNSAAAFTNIMRGFGAAQQKFLQQQQECPPNYSGKSTER